MTRMSPAVPALLLVLAGACLGPPSYAKNSETAPVKVKSTRNLKKYDECRISALKNLKKGSISKEKFTSELGGCKDRFPAASLYSKCKKDRLQEMRESGGTEIGTYCHKMVENIEYQPSSLLPFAVEEAQLFFAGIGLNQPQALEELNPPNFSCKKLLSTARNPSLLQYVLFGNHPRFFAGLAKESGANLRRFFPIERPASKGVDLPGYGRVYGDPGKVSAAVYFPSGNCTFEGSLGHKISGLSAHYLIDTAGSVAVPYFGIAYFHDRTADTTTAEVARQLAKILGPRFTAHAKAKNPGVYFVSAGDFAEIDDEQDPKNLCKMPRTHTYVGVVHGQPDGPEKPSFALVANIKNLCEFGDRLTGPRVH